MTGSSRQLTDELNPEHYVSLSDALQDACARYASRPAFHSLGTTIDFARLDALSRDFAAWLLNESRLDYGDRIAIQLPNLVQYPIAVLGALRAGLVLVNTNPLYTEREMLHQFNDSGAKALVVAGDLLPLVNRIVARTEIEAIISAKAGDTPLANAGTEEAEGSAVPFAQVLARGAELELPVVVTGMDDIAVLQYTGGTTGVPKAAMLTHSNIFAGCRQSTLAFDRKDDTQEVLIAAMPLYHIGGFTMNVVSSCLHGRFSALVPNPRDVDRLVETMKAFPVTGFCGVNTLFAALMQHPGFDEIDFSKLDAVISGGTMLLEDIASEWQRRTGSVIYEGYGLSETAAAATVNSPRNRRLGTVGNALPGIELRVVDDAGLDQPAGNAGELLIRGANVMQGYWKQPAATAEVLDRDGWFRSGDVATIDADGFTSIVGRLKDRIVVSGFNVYPNEIEAVVHGHPGVRDCAAVGVPDPAGGDAIRLFVVAAATLEADELRSWCRLRLSAHKVPNHIELTDELPTSNVGQVLRRALRAG